MKKYLLLTLTLCLLFITINTRAQVNYTANDQITPYPGVFRPGVNPGYYGGNWNDYFLTDIAAGNPAAGTEGVGVHAFRSSLPEFIALIYDYPTWEGIYDYYEASGVKDNTIIVGFAHPDHADPVEYCQGIPTQMFANLYEPIFDGGLNGTPINENNYYARYLWDLLESIGDHVKFWEIWNEPGFDYTGAVGWLQPGQPNNWWDNNPNPCDYKLRAPIFHFIRTLRISYEVVKLHSPDDYVVLSGSGYESFLDAVLRNTDNPTDGSPTADYPLGGGAYFDVIGGHFYPQLDGTMREWNTTINGWDYFRHSDRGADGLITKKNTRDGTLANYGYDGVTYPEKIWTLTEYNVPNASFPDISNPNEPYFGSYEGARNFIMKSYVIAMKEDFVQIHPYQLAERETAANSVGSFDRMGFFENLNNVDNFNQVVLEQGIGYKTTSEMLFGKTYDAAKTTEMNIPTNMNGGAFKNSMNEYTYVLWAKTQTDLSEFASGSYSFPASMNIGNLEKRTWDFAQTGNTITINSQNISLDGSPAFFTPTSNSPTGEITMSCVVDSVNLVLSVTLQEGGTNFSWTAPSATTTCPLGGVTITQIDGLANGSFFDIGGEVIAYEATDACGNVVECAFTVDVRSSGGGLGTAATGCHASREGFIMFGNYGGHKYFISKDAMTYAEGLAMAANQGGYLVAITDEAENEFLNSWNFDQAYIGLNDVNQEGVEVWDSGEPIGYTNYEDNTCTWCEPNTSTNDATEYHPWNGKWSWIAPTELRKVIMEIECAETLGCGCPTTNEPVCGQNGVTYINNCEAECAGQLVYSYGSCGGLQLDCDINIDPAQLTVAGTNDFSGNIVEWTPPTATTDCPGGIVSIEQIGGQPSGSFFVAWSSNPFPVVYEITDACGNSEICFNEFIVQGTPGSFTCPADITVNATSSDGAIVFYDAPVVVDGTCTGGNPGIINNNGFDKSSGSLFPIGTTEIEFTSFFGGPTCCCQNAYHCSFNVTVVDNSTGGGCPQDIAGFSTIGEYGTSKYYLSNDVSEPAAAQALAVSLGGYLVSINDQAENDFIQQNISELTYIGLNDANSEGNFEWFNGDVFSYNNINPCGFCNPNADEFDYVVMQSWNGAWSFSSQYNARKYIVEIPCGSTPSGFNVDCDLGESSLLVDASDPSGRVVTWNPPTATTDCAGGVTITQISGPPSGSFFNAWQLYVIVYQITDACGNEEICVNELEVQGILGNIICPDDITVETSSPDGVVVNYDLPTFNNTTCITGVPNLVVGLPSGAVFPIGTSEVTFVATFGGGVPCQVPAECTFTITVVEEGTGGGCPNDVAGFTTLGEFEGSKYYLSNAAARPSDAQFEAATHGGYLATISSQAENDFIQQYISEFAYIGLDDFDQEGNLEWINGEPLTFNNVDPCGFCNSNAPDQDFVIMAPWNGAWSFSNFYNQRLYVMEIPCDGQPSGDAPDLTISNITNLPASGTVGENVFFNFDLNNIGNATASGNYNINIYLSTDNVLSGNDNLVGTVPTGDTPVGTIANVSAALSVPAVADGNYFVIVKADDDEQITESNENNNTSTNSISITTGGGGGCPTSLAGFTALGEFGNSAYFLSNDAAMPTAAQATAVSNGGYLATIGSQAENDFIQQNISNLVYIGLSDMDSEGNPTWMNGETVSYTNYDICGFCNPNSADMDFVIMHSWNGGWSWSNFYNERRYVIEIPCTQMLQQSNMENTITGFSKKVQKPMLEKLVPNPAKDFIFTQIKTSVATEITIQIFDARGVMVHSQQAELFEGVNAVEMNIADLPSGFYSVYIPEAVVEFATQRFVKARE